MLCENNLPMYWNEINFSVKNSVTAPYKIRKWLISIGCVVCVTCSTILASFLLELDSMSCIPTGSEHILYTSTKTVVLSYQSMKGGI
jgi:hypothetical protein